MTKSLGAHKISDISSSSPLIQSFFAMLSALVLFNNSLNKFKQCYELTINSVVKLTIGSLIFLTTKI
ncbi:hypothetical protein DMN98_04970 [Vibrio parahaemolyticus]|nr:hypothetical protein [Vibrio parahaemolyticus]EGR3402633.1 hypothetical protein [Vibrio parahaemolyticus]